VNAYLTLVQMNLKMLFRARDVLFWNFAFPVLFMVLIGTAFGASPGFSAHVGIEGSGSFASALIQALRHIKGMSVSVISSGGIQALQSGHIEVLARIAGHQAHLIRTNASASQSVSSIVQGAVMAMNLQALHQPLFFRATVRQISVQGTSYIDFLAPGILGMTLMNTGLFSGTMLITHRSQGILRRIRGTPLPTGIFIGARITTQMVVALIQATLILVIAREVYHFTPVGNLWSLIPLLVLGELAFMTIGFFIAGVANTMEVASALTNIVSLPMMFLAGVFYPISQLPRFIKPLADILPLRYLTSGLRAVVVHGTPLTHLTNDFIALALVAVVCGALAVKFFRWEMPRV
jgi:ABC-2 type transport system permease protein